MKQRVFALAGQLAALGTTSHRRGRGGAREAPRRETLRRALALVTG